ncbi:hypothetical protein ACMDCR_00470 [Labrys okinawensis]
MSEFYKALQPGIRFYRWLDRLFARRPRAVRPAFRPMPLGSLHIVDGGSF